jgi:hypothetical protein
VFVDWVRFQYLLQQLLSSLNMLDRELCWLLYLSFSYIVAYSLCSKWLMSSHLNQYLFCFLSDSPIIVSKSIEQLVIHRCLWTTWLHLTLCYFQSCLNQLHSSLYDICYFVTHCLPWCTQCCLEYVLVITVLFNNLFTLS